MCFFFCMKKKQKIKLLDLLGEKKPEPETGEATFWCEKVEAAGGTL